MKVADLYIRVSTDEQADKGYSQRNQDETLQRYCQVQGITVGRIIYEDYSAKTFNRPAWQEMINRYKKKGIGRPDFILFIKWDRFSRNAADAYQMINLLRSYEIEPQAIEQPLDLTIPENKMMLAFYLAAPEVENDRRALNVFHGMRRAKKEGRWMATAPYGYLNKSHEDGRKYIAIDNAKATIMQWAFNEITTGQHSVEKIWREARRKGLSCTRNNFWSMIRNPVYCGKIVIPAYRDEPLQIVQAQHQPIVTEAVFEQVQKVLDEKKRKRTPKTNSLQIPLRGFLKCPNCGKTLTGSASKGCRSYYFYYHCKSTCGVRFNANQVNNALIDELHKYTVRPIFVTLFRKILREVIQKSTGLKFDQRHHTQAKILDQQTKFSRAKELLLTGDIDADDYREIKKETANKIAALEEILISNENLIESVDKRIKGLAESTLNLSQLYQRGSIEQKRKFVESLFPQKLIFSINGLSFPSPLELLELICSKPFSKIT